jgi:hypothetical protein
LATECTSDGAFCYATSESVGVCVDGQCDVVGNPLDDALTYNVGQCVDDDAFVSAGDGTLRTMMLPLSDHEAGTGAGDYFGEGPGDIYNIGSLCCTV